MAGPDWQTHPEGGSYAPVWRSAVEVPTAGGPRAAGSCIAYRLEPGERSRWHRVRSTELWLWQGGGGLLLSTGGTGERPTDVRRNLLGPGGVLQVVVAADEWQSAQPAEGIGVQVACVVVPGFDWADWQVLDQPAS